MTTPNLHLDYKVPDNIRIDLQILVKALNDIVVAINVIEADIQSLDARVTALEP